jgi:hypothetical protein
MLWGTTFSRPETACNNINRLHIHDHLKYPYFGAFCENEVKLGLVIVEKK